MTRKNAVSSAVLPSDEEAFGEVDVAGISQTLIGPFGLAVIGRAIPDVRDGLIPVRRRILFTAAEMGLRASGPTRKSAQLVGEVMGKYHPHGDLSIYGAVVNLAAEGDVRYPLLVGQGNMGSSLSGDPPAAARYTEVKLSPLGEQVVRDLYDRAAATVGWGTNYSEELDEPLTLPARFPLLLANGTVGIGWGDATLMLPHNLRELIAATCALIDNPDLPTAKLAKLLPAPDFPGGAIIVGNDDWAQILETGTGRVVVRARMHIENEARETRLVATEIPYGTQRGFKDKDKPGIQGRIVERVNGQAYDGKQIEATLDRIVADVRDESSADTGSRLVVVLEKGVSPERAAAALYRYTDLQSSYSVSQNVTVVLPGGIPTVQKLGTRQLLIRYAEYQFEVLTGRTCYFLRKAEAQLELEEAKIIANANAEELVRLVKAASDEADIVARIQKRYKTTERQASYIANLPLKTYGKMNMSAVHETIKRLKAEIAEYKRLLASRAAMNSLLKDELHEISSKWGDDRRTDIDLNASAEVPSEDEIIPDEPCWLTVATSGLVARHPASAFRAQKRGGVGVAATKNDDDPTIQVLAARTREKAWLLTDRGNLFAARVIDLDEVARGGRGTNVKRFLSLAADEKVVRVIVPPSDADGELVIATAGGKVLRSKLSDYANLTVAGLRAIKLLEGDRIVSANMAGKGSDLIAASSDGYAARFSIDAMPVQGRGSQGVVSMNLGTGAEVVSLTPIEKTDKRDLALLLSNGRGKKSRLSDYPQKGRAIRGVTSVDLRTAAKGGDAQVVFASPIGDDDQVAFVTSSSKVVVLDAASIKRQGRATAGVITVSLSASARNPETVSGGSVIGSERNSG